jgi:hypothetical protein
MSDPQQYPHDVPDNALIVLIGAAGAGKSTLAASWPLSQALSLDALRETVSGDFSVKFSLLISGHARLLPLQLVSGGERSSCGILRKASVGCGIRMYDHSWLRLIGVIPLVPPVPASF